MTSGNVLLRDRTASSDAAVLGENERAPRGSGPPNRPSRRSGDSRGRPDLPVPRRKALSRTGDALSVAQSPEVDDTTSARPSMISASASRETMSVADLDAAPRSVECEVSEPSRSAGYHAVPAPVQVICEFLDCADVPVRCQIGQTKAIEHLDHVPHRGNLSKGRNSIRLQGRRVRGVR